MSARRQVPLRDLVRIQRDILDPEEIADGTLYVGLENIESGGRLINVETVNAGDLASSKFSFTSRHLLYGKLRPYLAKIARPDFDGICSTDILPLLPGPDIDRAYLGWVLLSPTMVSLAASRASGANLPRLSPAALEEIKIALPPLSEQRRIAEILDKVDALLTKRQVAIAQLDALALSIFLDMFGDPATNPKGFPKQRLASLVCDGDTINYGVVQPGNDEERGVPLIRVGDLLNGRVKEAHLKRIAPSIEAAYKRSRLRGNELLVSCVGTIGVVATAGESVRGFNIARAVARVPIADDDLRTFLYVYLQTPYVQRYFYSELRTVSQPTLNIKQLSETQVLLPPRHLQRDFGLKLKKIEHQRRMQWAAQAQGHGLIQSLQEHAFRGEL